MLIMTLKSSYAVQPPYYDALPAANGALQCCGYSSFQPVTTLMQIVTQKLREGRKTLIQLVRQKLSEGRKGGSQT
ncbi:hypothetical protein ACOSQ4_026229 [Xanthoceras sorbifolium]